MKSVLIIGMGRLGKHLAIKFIELGNQVLAVDMSEESVNDVVSQVPNIQIGDCTRESIMRSLGVSNFDICVVAVGSNLGASLEITYQLKQLGAKYVIARVNRDTHGKFLMNNGADEIIYPEKQIADRLAAKHSAYRAFDYIEIMPGYSISEVAVPEKWLGQTVEHLAVRTRYSINILAVKRGAALEDIKPTHVFKNGEHIVIFGGKKEVIRFSQRT